MVRIRCFFWPEAIRSFAVRFTATLEPGRAVKTQIWRIDEHHVVFRLLDAETGSVVLNFCTAELD